MKKISKWQQVVGWLVLAMYTQVTAAETVRIVAAPTTPNVIVKLDQASGPAVDMLKKVVADLGMQSVVAVTPNYGRGFLELRTGNGDVLVFCTENAERNRSATFFPTQTKATLIWYSKPGIQYFPDSEDFKLHTTIGTYLNSNTQQWLTDNGYREQVATSDFEALVKLLDSGRVPVVFSVELPFEAAMAHLGLPIQHFQRRVQLERPFGFYFSNVWLAAHPNIAPKIRNAIIKFDYAAQSK